MLMPAALTATVGSGRLTTVMSICFPELSGGTCTSESAMRLTLHERLLDLRVIPYHREVLHFFKKTHQIALPDFRPHMTKIDIGVKPDFTPKRSPFLAKRISLFVSRSFVVYS